VDSDKKARNDRLKRVLDAVGRGANDTPVGITMEDEVEMGINVDVVWLDNSPDGDRKWDVELDVRRHGDATVPILVLSY
jgi:hypothetical protein